MTFFGKTDFLMHNFIRKAGILTLKSIGKTDFLISDYDNLNVLPIEIKSGKNQNNFRAIPKLVLNDGNYKLLYGYVFGNNNVFDIDNNLITLPIYLIMFV